MRSAAAFDLSHFLTEERDRADEALERALERLSTLLPAELEPVVRHGVLTGGKRLRPILCVAALRTCGGPGGASAHDLGASLELIHAYSLMHDDLPCMDDAELRRGRPTPHVVFGESATMRAGAVLIPAAALQALDACARLGCAPDECLAVASDLIAAAGAGGMVGGQALDLAGEGKALDADRLDALHRRKTGALLTAALTMGGRAAGASSEQLRALETYGSAVGLAFQIADDVLDATSSVETLGKNPSDSELDKSTYVSLYGLEEARRRAADQADAAVAALERVGLRSQALEGLARYVVERTR